MAMAYNPFRPGSLVTPGMFSGRIPELRQIERGLFQTKNGNPNHFLIEGERGIGKSSMFLYLDWVARGEMEPIGTGRLNFIVASVELREAMEYDDIVNAILIELRSQMSARDKVREVCKKAWDFFYRFEVMGVVRYDRNSNNEDRIKKLDDLSNALVDIVSDARDEIDGVLILIDEADKPRSEANLGELCKLLTERLTRRGCEKVSICLAGLPGLIGKLRDSHESSPRVFSVITLDPLEHAECKQVISRGLDIAAEKNGFKTEIEEEAMDMISSLSEGYPHFLQEFAFWAFGSDRDNKIDVDDVINGAFSDNGALHQLGKKYFTGLYIEQIGSEDYRKVLIEMAESLDGWVSRQHLIEKSGVKERIVDNALHALKDRNIIVQNPRVRGEYRLPTKSFAAWIKAREAGRASGHAPVDHPSEL